MHSELSADYCRILTGYRGLRNERKKGKKEKLLFDIPRNHTLLQKICWKSYGGKKSYLKKIMGAIMILSLISEGLIHISL